MKTNVLFKTYCFLTRLSPYLRLTFIRWIYNNYATKNDSEKNIFLNYGYYDENPLPLHPQDEPNRLFIQLYHRAVKDINLQNKDIVEVGCGQGAGGVFLMQYQHPRSYLGIDLSEKAIAFCQQHNQYATMQWMQGYADKLPIADESADVVINIESSHLYPSMKQFLNEVKRVLRPKGYMAFADLRSFLDVAILDHYFNDSGLMVLQRSDITHQVLESLTQLSDRRKAYINSNYSKLWRQSTREIFGVKGSSVYNGFINGQQRYLCYVLQKQ